MSILATRVRSTSLRQGEYACSRCGRIATWNQRLGRTKPTECKDCRGIEARIQRESGCAA